jgi:hypothetical protein
MTNIECIEYCLLVVHSILAFGLNNLTKNGPF